MSSIMAAESKDSLDLILSGSDSSSDDDSTFSFRSRGKDLNEFRPRNPASSITASSRRPWRIPERTNHAVVKSPPKSPPPRSESKRERKVLKLSKGRKPRYPLDGTSPSERIVAGFCSWADSTLDIFERQCGIEEEMQTVRDDVAWCGKTFC